MKYNGKVLGVFGGMGPLATAEFLRLLALDVPANCDQEHPKIIVIENPQTPDRTQSILGQGPSPEPYLKEGLIKLIELGVNYLAVPCNTSHYFIANFDDGIQSKLINIVHETIGESKVISPNGAWLTATIGTIKTGLYQKMAKDMSYRILEPNEDEKNKISQVIDMVKAGNYHEASFLYKSVIGKLWERENLPIIAACTELPIAYQESNLPKEKMVSSIEALARGCIRKLYISIKEEK